MSLGIAQPLPHHIAVQLSEPIDILRPSTIGVLESKEVVADFSYLRRTVSLIVESPPSTVNPVSDIVFEPREIKGFILCGGLCNKGPATKSE